MKENKSQIKTVFYDGMMLIGETIFKNGKYRMSNPLMVRQLPRTDGSEPQLHLSPFGMGFIENPLVLPTNIIFSKTSKYGISQYTNATVEINKLVNESKKPVKVEKVEEPIKDENIIEIESK